ncbi:MAG: hypothetical protein KUG61_05195 [Parvibaculaceae bacterium]|nr:hypothetical protein [Parvibaculaceae bacterium]
MNRFSVFIAAAAVAFLGVFTLPASAEHHAGVFTHAETAADNRADFRTDGQLGRAPISPGPSSPFATSISPVGKIVVAAGGRKVPLDKVLKNLRRKYKGKHLSASEKKNQYRIKWKTPDGRVRLIVVDSRTGREL